MALVQDWPWLALTAINKPLDVSDMAATNTLAVFSGLMATAGSTSLPAYWLISTGAPGLKLWPVTSRPRTRNRAAGRTARAINRNVTGTLWIFGNNINPFLIWQARMVYQVGGKFTTGNCNKVTAAPRRAWRWTASRTGASGLI